MSAAALISNALSAGGYSTISPDLRSPSTVLSSSPFFCIYEIKSTDIQENLDNTANAIIYYTSVIDIICYSVKLSNALTTAEQIALLINGQTYTYLNNIAYMMSVTGLSEGYLEDSLPGGLDKIRTVTITVKMFHYST